MPIFQTDTHLMSALFPDLQSARRAVESLRRRGIPDERMSIASSGEHYQEPLYRHVDEEVLRETDAVSEHGTEAGAAMGGLGGFLLGLALITVPGVGPILTIGGILTSTLTGAAVGGLTGGLMGLLAKVGIPEEQAQTYQQQISRGRALVVVQAEPSEAREVHETLLAAEPISPSDAHEISVGR